MDNQAEEIVSGAPLSNEEKSWQEYFLKGKQAEISKIEETAKFMTGLLSIIIALFQLNADLFKDTSDSPAVGCAIAAWIFALIAAIFVLFPMSYPYNTNAISALPIVHESIVSRKRTILKVSAFCFIFGIILFSYNFINHRNVAKKKEEAIKYILISKDSLSQNTIIQILPDTIKK
jgi:hypothetical protein